MRFGVSLLLLLALAPAPAPAQTKSKPPASRLGMTCDQVLKMSSTEWIAYSRDHSVDAAAAIKAYGVCYDARTNALAGRLARSGRGPSARAKADFQDFDKSIQDFSTKVLASAAPPADAVKSALAALYEKQFRYDFYEGHEIRPVSKPKAASAKEPANEPKAATQSTQAASAASRVADADERANNVDEMTRAKNRFGELLGALPDDKIHELHEAFGRILGLHSEGPETQLAVYRYAIFLMELSENPASQDDSSQKSFSAPPF